jgi:hypothetical protein
MKDIWQQTEARDDAKELQTHIEEFDGVRRKQRATQVEKEQLVQQQKQPTYSGGVKFVTVNGQDNEGEQDRRRWSGISQRRCRRGSGTNISGRKIAD